MKLKASDSPLLDAIRTAIQTIKKILFFSLLFELQTHRVDAISFAALLLRTVIKYVAKMRAAILAYYFRAPHAMTGISF